MPVVIKHLFEFLIKFVFLSFFFSKLIFSFQPQNPDDYRIYYANRPILELTFDFAKWLSHAPESSDTFKTAKRKLSRMFNTEACLNGSFLALPDTHFHTSSNNPGIDLDQVINVMEKLRSCDSTIQELVCFINLKLTFIFLFLHFIVI